MRYTVLWSSLLFILNFSNAMARQVDSLHYSTVLGDSLWMNSYAPSEENIKNETIVFVHGGGFFMGSRNHPLNDSFCLALAQEGYQVYSVDYYLSMKGIGFGCNVPAQQKEGAILNAQKDVETALNYLENRGLLNGEVHLMGSSAGAETILSMLFNNPKREYASLVSFAGALTHVQGRKIETETPILLIQGDADEFVPYGTSAHRGCSTDAAGYMIMDGSYTIYESLCDKEQPSMLITYHNGPHAVCNFFFENIDEILSFLQGSYQKCSHITKEF